MKKRSLLGLLCLAQGVLASAACGAEFGSSAEAEAMVKKALALIKEVGPEKAYKVFTEHPDGQFRDRDLYVFAYSFDGICLAQGHNPKLVGKNLMSMRDINDNYFIAGTIDMVKAKGRGWYGPFKFLNAANNQYEAQRSWCEASKDAVICVGTHGSP
jgi:signal transduction histidine kinase